MDDHTCYTWIYLMCTKGETRAHNTNFTTLAENQFNTHVKIISIDNDIEISMNHFLNSKRIIHQTSCIKTPRLNDIVECKHKYQFRI